jgi:type II secretory pathway pseudopilin PulG
MKFVRSQSRSGFTMVEIALCLAIVGFALVAIIGVLPAGMNVQRDNRQETIINQDAALLLDAIRNGAHGYDDLTNHLVAITNYWSVYNVTNNTRVSGPDYDGYTLTDSLVTSVTGVDPDFAADDGYRIIGLLSTPRYIDLGGGLVQSNYTIAYFRAMSGAAVEKTPQNNADILEGAFAYRLIVENTPYVPMEVGTNAPDVRMWNVLRENSHDLRLTFRWPLLPRYALGNGRQTYRQLVGGILSVTNDGANHPLHFFQPKTFIQVP